MPRKTPLTCIKEKKNKRIVNKRGDQKRNALSSLGTLERSLGGLPSEDEFCFPISKKQHHQRQEQIGFSTTFETAFLNLL